MAKNQRAAEDLLADLNDLPDDPDALPVGETGDADEASINEFLAEFERPSRPITPRLSGSKARNSPRLSTTEASRSRRSQDVGRTSTDSKRSNKESTQSFTNSSAAGSEESEKTDETDSVQNDAQSDVNKGYEQKKVYGSNTSWSAWGGSLWSTANNIQTQLRAEAEKRLADLQVSEEAQRIQARLRELDLSKIASEARNIGKGVLDAVAPPIEDNETLIVNVLHDLTGLSVERSIYNSFERVMEQVEGGSLHIIAKDREGSLETNAISGSVHDARKMSLAAIEDQARDNKAGPVERTSKIYLSLQAFGRSTSITEKGKEKAAENGSDDSDIQILMTLVDPANSITFSSISQSFPSSWIPLSLQTVEAAMQPREWINEWLEESIQLTAGVIAQRYVARRMGLDNAGAEHGQVGQDESTGGMKIKEGQDLSEAGLGL